MIRKLPRSEGGYVLVTALIALAVMSILAIATIDRANTVLRMSRQAVREEQALYMANAGVEFIYARLTATDPPETTELNQPYSYTMQLGQGVTGQYVVTAADRRPGFLEITSTGTIIDSGGDPVTRTLVAEVPFERDDGGGGGSPTLPDRLVVGNGPIHFNNNAQICGDVFARGDLRFDNNVTVWSKTKAEDSKSPCNEILGYGRAVSTGRLTKGNNTVIQGGWCDSITYGTGTPCDGSKPKVETISTPNFATLKDSAQVWYVRQADEAYCLGRANCQTFSGTLALSGNKSYPNQLVYVDGNVTVGSRLVINGNVTFAATGDVSIHADVECAGGTTCNVAFLAGADVSIFHNKAVWATLLAGNALGVGNSVEIHGLISASNIVFGNTPLLYPTSNWPVGVPGNPNSDGAGGSSPSGGYSKWNP